MTPTRRIAVGAAMVSAAFVFATPAQAHAAPAGAADFGQHVRTCAQVMGFAGDHNPGMHHGHAGWTGMTCTGSTG